MEKNGENILLYCLLFGKLKYRQIDANTLNAETYFHETGQKVPAPCSAQ